MTLRELCEPLFLFVARLNRSARKGGAIDYRHARSEIESILADMKSRSAANPGLRGQFEAIEPALIFFVDSMIAESKLPFAAEWHENRLAYDANELAGDEKFFDILEETLEEKGASADERLGILYTCMGMGMTGFYAGQPEYLRSKMMDCSVRLRDQIDADEANAITPAAYEHLDTRQLPVGAAVKLGFIAVLFVCLILATVVIALVGYRSANSQLGDDLDTIRTLASDAEEASS